MNDYYNKQDALIEKRDYKPTLTLKMVLIILMVLIAKYLGAQDFSEVGTNLHLSAENQQVSIVSQVEK